MRVAHLITRLILGGAQENTLLNCEDLAEIHQDEVLLITGPALGPEGTLIDRAQNAPIQVEIVDSLRRAIHPGRDWKSYQYTKQLLRDFRPDVVHTHSAKGGIIGRFAATALGVPAIVHTVHGAPFYAEQNWLGYEFARWCEWAAARRCHQLISVADAMTDLLVSAKVAPREKFVTIYSGMEVEPFLQAEAHREATRTELGYSAEHLVIGKIARLFHLKGHEYVIAAAQGVIEAFPQARFLFVGDGILQQQFRQQIHQAGLNDHFQFTGLVPPERIPALISAMDILVHTSLREGLARALVQALLAGRPAVSFDLDGAGEVVLDGQTGFLVPAKDVATLAERLKQLLGNPELRSTMGQQGRALCQDRFRHEYMTARIREVYERLLQSRPSR